MRRLQREKEPIVSYSVYASHYQRAMDKLKTGQLPTKLMKWPHRNLGLFQPTQDQISTSELPAASARLSQSAPDSPWCQYDHAGSSRYSEGTLGGREPRHRAQDTSLLDDPEFDACLDESYLAEAL